MENPEDTFTVVATFVRFRYRPAALVAGVSKRDFKDWAQSMAGLGIAKAYKSIDKFDPELGSFVNYAIFKAKEEVRASLRELHRYKKATEVMEVRESFQPRAWGGGIRYYLTLEEATTIYELLSADQQRAMALEHEGYDANEIAQMMAKKSHNTIRTLLRRARVKSRELLSVRLSWRESSKKPRGDTDDEEPWNQRASL